MNMRTPSRFLLLGLCSLALLQAGINDGVGGVGVGLSKNPPGKILALATTDASGTVRFRISEPGTYTIEIQNPLGTASAPEGAKAMTVKLQGQASKAVGSKGIGQLKLPSAISRNWCADPRPKSDSHRTRTATGSPSSTKTATASITTMCWLYVWMPRSHALPAMWS
jgi:hypothetical protein